MKALFSGCLTLVVGLAGGLASNAEARETAAARAVTSKTTARPSATPARALSNSRVTPLSSASPKHPAASLSASSSLLGPVSPRDAAVATVTTTTQNESAGEDATVTPAPAQLLPRRKSNGNKFLLFTDGLLEDMGDLPVLGVFILPVTEGVTIPTFEGLTSLTFAVKPTKITRGSGVVAIGTFD